MTNSMKDALVEISRYSNGYPACWKTKTREKLEAAGLVVKQPGQYGPNSYFVTGAGSRVIDEIGRK